jgi:glutathione S-transferase
LNRSGYVREICEYLDGQLNPKYIFGTRMTIADFLFMETCNYMLGLSGNVDKYPLQPKEEEESKELVNFLEGSYRAGKKPNKYYLKVMRDYRQRLQNHSFYQKHMQFLESFSIISIFTSQERAAGLRKIWLLDDFFVK